MHISSSVRVGSVFWSGLGQFWDSQVWDSFDPARFGTGLGQSVLSQSGLGKARVSQVWDSFDPY